VNGAEIEIEIEIAIGIGIGGEIAIGTETGGMFLYEFNSYFIRASLQDDNAYTFVLPQV